MSQDVRDITIIGGGPTGLFAAFYAGMRGLSARILDSLPELGGQLTALYPEKYIFDVGGFPKVLAKELADELIAQALQFEPDVVLDEEVRAIHRDEDGVLHLESAGGKYLTRALLVAGGKGVGATLAHNVNSPDEVDAVLAEARSAGATIARPGAKTFWGGYSGVFIDPDGHPWEVAHNPGWTVHDDGRTTLE
jgi:uncharacterized glyoxalase superfamily protein PhnB